VFVIGDSFTQAPEDVSDGKTYYNVLVRNRVGSVPVVGFIVGSDTKSQYGPEYVETLTAVSQKHH